MHEKNKNPSHLLILIGLSVLFIPFIFITDFFPFMRMGMFAEPVRYSAQQESFLVLKETSPNKKKPVDSQSFGIAPHNFQYLCRNHHYRHEDSLLLRKVHYSLGNNNANKLHLCKIIHNDTLMLFTFAPVK